MFAQEGITYRPIDHAYSWRTYYLAQHHGIPTRLLDWTESFSAALFFALDAWNGESVPCIWIMQPCLLNEKFIGWDGVVAPEQGEQYNIWLTYISFHDEVQINDVSRAFRTAVKEELANVLKDGARFACITHSTGGPVIRDWWHRYYGTVSGSVICPMSHLIMLAPANFGSALAQLGKGRLSRIKSWFGGVEPGQGVLDWLELGSEAAWNLNGQWIQSDGRQIGPKGMFPFTLTGQYIDRSFYDHLNTYTGEMGSDGVVRVAAANLNGRYIKLIQQKPIEKKGKKGFEAKEMTVEKFNEAPKTAFRVISQKAHSGAKMGIMRSVKPKQDDRQGKEVVSAILDCLKVQTKAQYNKLSAQFAKETEHVQQLEFHEIEKHFLRSDTDYFHDTFSMIIFRVRDDQDYPISDFDLILTAGPKGDPNHLPRGFFADRQRNRINPETITYFFNYNVMAGMEEVKDKNNNVIREKLVGADTLGVKIIARPESGFVKYLPCEIKASGDLLKKALHPNSTTLIDIRLQRVVGKNVFRVEKLTKQWKTSSFKGTKPGDPITD